MVSTLPLSKVRRHSPHSKPGNGAFASRLLTYTNDLISVHDPGDVGRYRYASPSHQRLLGYSPADLLGQPALLLVHPDDQVQMQQHLAALDERVATEATLRYRHRDASWRWFETRWHLLWQAGRSHILVVSRDVTEYHRLETRISQIQKLNSIGRLAAGVAHDFRNVMTGIDGCAAVAQIGLPLDSATNDDLAEIRRSAARANSLINQLLDFARRSDGSVTLLDLDVVIDDLARLLRRLIGEDVEMVVRSSTEPAFIQGDRGQIEQVLMNMAINARDAMPLGGQLTFETRTVVLNETINLHHTDRAPGRYVVLTIRDTGTGMESHTLARIFEPFFTTKPAGAGTGLGLAICDEIVRQHGGWISVRSEPGEGTAFSISLPQAADAAALPTVSATASAALPRGSETVLIVEDDAVVRWFAARALRAQGYTALTASKGAEALELARAHRQPIDLLLADLVLPQLRGTAVAARLRASNPALRVIFMSGYPDVLHTDDPTYTAMAYLQKPFELTTLVQTVRTVLDTKIIS